MLRRFIAPLHPDGFKFVLAGAVVTLLLFFFWIRVGWIAAGLTLITGYDYLRTGLRHMAEDQPARGAE